MALHHPKCVSVLATQASGHMREAAECTEALQAARAQGLARERQLAAEVATLRDQLAGRLPEGDPARAMQVRRSQLGSRAMPWEMG
jgi:hypothetical protein